jgi:HlyD family secretion protein
MSVTSALPPESLSPLSKRGLSRPVRNGRRRVGWKLVPVAVVCLAAAAWAGYSRLDMTSTSTADQGLLTVPVKRGDLLITVNEDGNLESGKNVDIKCQVPGSLTILEIVTDGAHVKKGDLLVRLDSSMLEDAILAQQIVQAKAEAARITAEKNFSASKIAVDEYREGTFVQSVEQLDATITMARQTLASAENVLFYAKKMHRNGYASELEVESKKFAVEQAKLNLSVAQTKKDVLEKYTRQKMLEDLTSKRDSADALMKSQQQSATQESSKLRRLEENLDRCLIRAQTDGMVIYANDMGGGRRGPSEAPKIELGANVRQFQTILRMPDIKHMQVKTLVHETKVHELRRGLRARVKVLDREFQGQVVSIANQPEAASRQSNNVKEYATIVALDGEPEGLKPGMTTELEILVEQKKDVLTVPIQCVVKKGKKQIAWIKTPTGVELRELVLGSTDDVSVEIIDGLKEGEQVLLNPRAMMAPDEQEEAEEEEDHSATAKSTGPRDAAPADGNRGPRRDRENAAGPADGAAPGSAGSGRPGSGQERRGPPGGGPPGGGPPAGEGMGGGGNPGMGGGGWGGGGMGGGAGGGARRGGGRRLNFKELDKNGDGKVSLEEMPEDRRERFSRMDTNGDGFIDQDEQKAMEERMRQMQQQGGWGGGQGGWGGGQQGGGPPGGQ